MAEAYDLSCWPSNLAHESKLSRSLESHHGLVPRLSHHEWKKHRPSGSKTDISKSKNHFFAITMCNVFLATAMFLPDDGIT